MFRPNRRGTLRRKDGYDVHGRPRLSIPRGFRFSQVRLGRVSGKTPGGQDSASAGSARQIAAADAVILVPKKADIEIGDILTIDEMDYCVRGVEPRRDVMGRLDHHECALEVYEE